MTWCSANKSSAHAEEESEEKEEEESSDEPAEEEEEEEEEEPEDVGFGSIEGDDYADRVFTLYFSSAHSVFLSYPSQSTFNSSTLIDDRTVFHRSFFARPPTLSSPPYNLAIIVKTLQRLALFTYFSHNSPPQLSAPNAKRRNAQNPPNTSSAALRKSKLEKAGKARTASRSCST